MQLKLFERLKIRANVCSRLLHLNNLAKINNSDSKLLFESSARQRMGSVNKDQARVINGREHAKHLTEQLTRKVRELKAIYTEFRPKLVVVQVGSLPDSSAYVRVKVRAAETVGISCEHVWLPQDVSKEEILQRIDALNSDSSVHGVIVQLPLPEQLNELEVTARVSPEKDVDGFHPLNIGNLAKRGGVPHFVACTPRGVLELLDRENVQIPGSRCVIIGRSNIVGLPLFQLFLSRNATPTLCHRGTVDLKSVVAEADILVVACGSPELVKGDWIKLGSVVVDVGINPIPDESKKSGFSYVGDVDFANARQRASLITPVPGGVGPMTVTMLLDNTLKAAINFLKLQM